MQEINLDNNTIHPHRKVGVCYLHDNIEEFIKFLRVQKVLKNQTLVNKEKTMEIKLNEKQMKEIKNGIKSDVDISVYSDPKFDRSQMEEIRKGLEAGLDVSIYAKPEFSWFQMEQIMLGLKAGVDVKVYADPKLDYRDMSKMRWDMVRALK